jgi:hypothetical protein
MSHAGSVTSSNIPELTISVNSCVYFYRYQLMFHYGSTCSLVETTKLDLQLENFPRSYGED